jgi:hypothetical protein
MKSTTFPLAPSNIELFHSVIRLSKEDSAFLYFTLEANEGLCLYSTLPHKQGENFRDVEIKGDLKFQPQINHLLMQLEKLFPLMVLNSSPV